MASLRAQDASISALRALPLSAEQQTSLFRLIEREVTAAEAGGVTAFRADFYQRRSPGEITETGLDTLSAAQKTQLNRTVAELLSSPANSIQVLRKTQPAERIAVGLPGPRWRRETSITAFYGHTSGQGDFYGTEVSTLVGARDGSWWLTATFGRAWGDLPYYRDSRRGYHRQFDDGFDPWEPYGSTRLEVGKAWDISR